MYGWTDGWMNGWMCVSIERSLSGQAVAWTSNAHCLRRQTMHRLHPLHSQHSGVQAALEKASCRYHAAQSQSEVGTKKMYATDCEYFYMTYRAFRDPVTLEREIDALLPFLGHFLPERQGRRCCNGWRETALRRRATVLRLLRRNWQSLAEEAVAFHTVAMTESTIISIVSVLLVTLR